LAKEIKDRFSEPLSIFADFCFGFLLDFVEGDVIAIVGIIITAVFPSGRKVVTFLSQEEEKKHGVTLLHILSELHGNEFP